MTKEQMKLVLDKVDTLEKLLMRNLDETEVNYLIEHSVDDFLYDILGFEKEDILVLTKIKKIISDWCTRPDIDVNTVKEDINLFYDTPEFEDETSDVNFFKETSTRINGKISNILSNILDDLEKEKRNYVVKEDSPKLEVTSNSKKPKEFEFSDEETFSDEECGNPISENEVVSVVNMIPDCAKKWVSDLTHTEIADAINKATETLVDDYIKNHPEMLIIDTSSIELNDDEIASEIVDKIKDTAINHYVSIIQREGEFEFSDSEIQSEVLDYLYKHNYKVKSINNKVSLV
jgi:hypothetical protein